MSGLNKLFSFDGLTEFQRDCQPGRYAGLMVVASGSNQTGQTGGLADIGRFEITFNGEPIINRDCEKFGDMNDIRGGKYTLNSTSGGAFEAVVFIPFFEKGHPNVLDVRGNNSLNARFIPADDGTVFSALDVTVNASLVPSLRQRYIYKINGADQNFSAAQSADDTPLNKRNVSAIYLDDVDDTISLLAFSSMDRNVVTTNDWLALQGYTNVNNRIEDAAQDIVEIQNHVPGQKGTLLNRNNVLTFTTSGAGAVDITVCSIQPTAGFGNRKN